MELSWDTDLDQPEKVLESLDICGISLQRCAVTHCPKLSVVNEHLYKVMSGKTFPFSELIQELSTACSSITNASCDTLKDIRSRLAKTGNAYLSHDGRKFWPDPASDRAENRVSRFSNTYNLVKRPVIGSEAPLQESSIVTMGSCFMNEINKILKEQDLLKYLNEENCTSSHSFSANWGTVFSPLSALRCLEFYLEGRRRPELLWKSSHSGLAKVYDVFREDVTFDSIAGYRLNMIQHRENARRVLSECSIFVCAFSMIETWLTNDGTDFPLARSPWRANPLAARPYIMTVDEVKEAVRGIFSILRRYNPDCKVFIGVDPVPLHATHSAESCILADSKAKAVLLSGIREAINDLDSCNIRYVPFFERIHYCVKDPWASDERHVRREACTLAYQELISAIRVG